MYKVKWSEKLLTHRIFYNLHNELLPDNVSNFQTSNLIPLFMNGNRTDKCLSLKLFLSCCWKFNVTILVKKDRDKIV